MGLFAAEVGIKLHTDISDQQAPPRQDLDLTIIDGQQTIRGHGLGYRKGDHRCCLGVGVAIIQEQVATRHPRPARRGHRRGQVHERHVRCGSQLSRRLLQGTERSQDDRVEVPTQSYSRKLPVSRGRKPSD